jgi:predicted nucleic acid-binding protein
MTLFVVDASVGIKLFLPEIHSAAAGRLRNPSFQLHVPGLFDVEIGNILWKKIRRGELTRKEADAILLQLPLLPLVRHVDAPLIPTAVDMACKIERTVYDSLYLVLALQLGGQMVTADERLCNSLSNTPWASSVLWVENVP